ALLAGPRSAEGRLPPRAGPRARAARRARPLRIHEYAALGEPPGPVRSLDDLVQPGRGRVALGGRRRDQRDDGAHRGAGFDPGLVPGDCTLLPDHARAPAVADPRRDPGDVYRARRVVRERRAPAHHPVDAALGGRRRAARAARLPGWIYGDRANAGV